MDPKLQLSYEHAIVDADNEAEYWRSLYHKEMQISAVAWERAMIEAENSAQDFRKGVFIGFLLAVGVGLAMVVLLVVFRAL